MQAVKLTCPKCGYIQAESAECRACGIIFLRYIPPSISHGREAPTKQHAVSAKTPKAWFRRCYRIFRWATLAQMVLVFILILRPSAPPPIAATPDALQRATFKLQEFQASAQEGREGTLKMDESELNGWLDENLALKRPAGRKSAPGIPGAESAITLAKKSLAPRTNQDPNSGGAPSVVRDVRIALRDNSLCAYLVFDFHGVDLSLELEGRLLVRDGCLRLEPTGGKIGSLPLLAKTFEGMTQRIFDAPENRNTFRLPAHIRDVRIERSQLIISTQQPTVSSLRYPPDVAASQMRSPEN